MLSMTLKLPMMQRWPSYRLSGACMNVQSVC